MPFPNVSLTAHGRSVLVVDQFEEICTAGNVDAVESFCVRIGAHAHQQASARRPQPDADRVGYLGGFETYRPACETFES